MSGGPAHAVGVGAEVIAPARVRLVRVVEDPRRSALGRGSLGVRPGCPRVSTRVFTVASRIGCVHAYGCSGTSDPRTRLKVFACPLDLRPLRAAFERGNT